MSSNSERYVFMVEWFDQPADIVRSYQLTYFLSDNSVEMYDMKLKRIFLKRSVQDNLTMDNFFIGSVIMVFCRQLTITGYADLFTEQKFESKKERTFAMIKPDCIKNLGNVIKIIEKAGFLLARLKMVRFTKEQAMEFYQEHRGKPFFENLINFMTSGNVVGMELVGQNGIKKWRDLLGPTNTQVFNFYIKNAKQQAPNSIRAQFGTDGTQNACHGSDSQASAQRELNMFFQGNLKTTANLQNCTCGVIKPHAIKDRYCGEIISQIQSQNLQITALEIFYLDKPSSEEFLEIYKNLIPEISEMVNELTMGPCIAMELCAQDVVERFRKVCGPYDPEISRTIRKETLRAKYGINIAQNAIHCTDLEEDGQMECDYFFNILQKN